MAGVLAVAQPVDGRFSALDTLAPCFAPRWVVLVAWQALCRDANLAALVDGEFRRPIAPPVETEDRQLVALLLFPVGMIRKIVVHGFLLRPLSRQSYPIPQGVNERDRPVRKCAQISVEAFASLHAAGT